MGDTVYGGEGADTIRASVNFRVDDSSISGDTIFGGPQLVGEPGPIPWTVS